MAQFVLDASVALSWCFPDDPSENTPYSRAILEYLAEADAVVPEIWPFEIANGIFVAYNKRKRITEAAISDYIQLLGSLPSGLYVQNGLGTSGWNRWRENTILPPTMLRISTWRSATSFPLATTDKELIKAAVAEGVAII